MARALSPLASARQQEQEVVFETPLSPSNPRGDRFVPQSENLEQHVYGSKTRLVNYAAAANGQVPLHSRREFESNDEYQEYLLELQIEGLRHEKKYGRDIGELKFIHDDFERHKERFREELVGIVQEHTNDQVKHQTEMVGAAYRQEMALKDKDKEY